MFRTLLVSYEYFLLLVPTFKTIILQSEPARVGNVLNLSCVVTTVNGVEFSSIMFSWVGPGGNSVTNDGRITKINPATSTGNSYTSGIQFTYLMEGDEGTYTCNVMILETHGSASVTLETLASKLPLILIKLYFVMFLHFLAKISVKI